MKTQDAQRILLGALNGLVGVLLLENETQAAIAAFRQVLSIGAQYSTSKSLVAFISAQVWVWTEDRHAV